MPSKSFPWLTLDFHIRDKVLLAHVRWRSHVIVLDMVDICLLGQRFKVKGSHTWRCLPFSCSDRPCIGRSERLWQLLPGSLCGSLGGDSRWQCVRQLPVFQLKVSQQGRGKRQGGEHASSLWEIAHLLLLMSHEPKLRNWWLHLPSGEAGKWRVYPGDLAHPTSNLSNVSRVQPLLTISLLSLWSKPPLLSFGRLW